MTTKSDLGPYEWFQSADSWSGRPSTFSFYGEIFEVKAILGKGGQSAGSFLVEGRLRPNLVVEQYVFKFLKEGAVAQAQKEALRFNRIKQLPNVIKIGQLRDTILHDRKLVCLVYDFVSGATLDDYGKKLKDKGQSMPGSQLKNLCIDFLTTIKSLHSVGIIHRDIKPANIIIDESNAKSQLTLIDFGLIALSDAPFSTIVAGTPGFASPEVWDGSPPNPKQDVWGFAASLVDFLIGPLDDLLVPKNALRNYHVQKPPDQKLALLDPLAQAILKILFRGLEKTPDNRPTVDEFIGFLTAVDELHVDPRKEQSNSFVEGLLSVRIGSTGVLAPVDYSDQVTKSFNWLTHVNSLVDENLMRDLLQKKLKNVFLTGNPGDGKTTFITRLRDLLIEAGGTYVGDERFTGWQIKLGEHKFAALYDASESVEGISSNQRLRNILKLSNQDSTTAIIAANDGRLDAFFLEFSDEFDYAKDVKNQLRGSKPLDSGIRVVDLKRRALISLSGDGGLVRKNLERFVSNENDWRICEECSSRSVCPILRNRNFLNNQNTMKAVEDLLLVSHLQREERATFRNIRSVFAYLITADKSCADVHEAKNENINLSKFPGLAVHELAFDENAKDALIRHWSKFDPASLALPGVRRAAVRTNSLVNSETGLNNLPNLSREIFFNQIPEGFDLSEIKDVYFYLHLDSYRLLLSGNSKAIKLDLLNGLSGMSGFNVNGDRGLLIGGDNLETDWSVTKIIPSDEFDIETDESIGSPYLEGIVDGATLRHKKSGVSLPLSLDSFELIMRVANGSLINDRFSDSVFQEVRSFTNQLQKEQVSSAYVVDAGGKMIEAVIVNGKIKLEKV